ncbi:GPP34 family phosphoprotein [Curtobacterium flaccumfaciens pv. flaccumfaciens]|uniref:GOLPH3/VPS74 family protein n=1 Tax=Curtobacterium flaccumfaciens TaxID=2035 RepID=UPI00217DC903|nr:GPP34 family phosphoprotein [Curtobacterium flaccumfaciens]MCS6547160.1 GPP34 family phosphoprotein [Curtobacterium flaccumfaciens pv. flaccumfaciens]
MAEQLTVPQAFALLQVEPDGRHALDGSTLDTGLAGAVLADLALRGAVSLQDGLVAVVNGAATGEPVLDGVVGTIAAVGAPRKAKWWVSRLGKRQLRDDVFAGLVARGIISVEQGKVLGLFPTTKHPERDRAPEALLRSGIADVLGGRAGPTPFSAAVIGLLDATNTLRKQFGAVDKDLVKEITSGTWASPAVKAVLEEIEAATIVVIMAATMATTTSIVTS